jgi:pimeloyl-ACP methyl ester carboxylesterase
MDEFHRLDFSPDDALEDSVLIENGRRFGLACLAESGALLGHVSTAESVRDLELIRSALGEERIDFLGYSNGTFLGAGYAQLFGERVGRMVLDGATHIADSRVSQAAGFERALQRMGDWCRGTRCLPDRENDAPKSVTDLLRRLDAKPLPKNDRLLTQSLALAGIAATLYAGERGWPVLGDALEAADRGEAGPLLALSDLLTWRQSDGQYEQVAYSFPASSCADREVESLAQARARSRRENAQAPVLGPFWGPDLLCSLWPVNPPPRLPRLTGAEAPPMVVIGTTGDPATPYERSQAAARQLAKAVLVTNEGEGHTAGGDRECVVNVVVPFLESGQLPADGQRC